LDSPQSNCFYHRRRKQFSFETNLYRNKLKELRYRKKKMVFLTLFFYVHPSTVPTRAVLRKRNFLFHIGRFLRMKKHVQFNFVFPPHLMASRDINLNNKDNIPNKLIPAFSDFHHPIRSVKAKLFSITSIFDKDNTTKLEFMNKIIITTRSSVRPESFTLTHNHVRINDRSSRSSPLLYHLWSYRRTDVRTFLYHLWPYRRTASTTKCLTVY